MLRIAIVEDDLPCARQLEQYISDFGRESGRGFSVTVYRDGADLMEQFRAQFDIILMDIQMPLLDGMTAAECVRRQDQEVVIIFITNMPQYAIRGYQVDALDYVLKPVEYFPFTQRLNRAILRVKNRQKFYLTLPVKGGVVKLAAGDLCYVESQGHQLTYHTRTGAYLTAGAIGQAEEQLAGQGFFRCNKGCLVNLEHVEGVREGCALVNGALLPISRGRKTAFLEAHG